MKCLRCGVEVSHRLGGATHDVRSCTDEACAFEWLLYPDDRGWLQNPDEDCWEGAYAFKDDDDWRRFSSGYVVGGRGAGRMICIKCGAEIEDGRNRWWEWVCFRCRFTYRVDPRCGPKYNHVWREPDGHEYEVPDGCLLVVSWESEA